MESMAFKKSLSKKTKRLTSVEPGARDPDGDTDDLLLRGQKITSKAGSLRMRVMSAIVGSKQRSIHEETNEGQNIPDQKFRHLVRRSLGQYSLPLGPFSGCSRLMEGSNSLSPILVNRTLKVG